MIPVRLGESRQPGSIEVDAIVVDEVRILIRVHATGREPDLPVLLVHTLDLPDHPASPGDLVLHPARGPVVEVEVPPAISLRHPDDLFPVTDVVTELPAGVVDERIVLRSLLDESSGFTRVGVHLDDAVHLVPTLVVLEGEGPAVVPPRGRGNPVRVGEEGVVDDRCPPAPHVEEHRLPEIHHVTGFLVIPHGVPGLELIGWGGDDVEHFPPVARYCPVTRQLPGVGGPGHGPKRVEIPLRPVVAEGRALPTARRPQVDVVVLDVGLQGPVRGGNGVPAGLCPPALLLEIQDFEDVGAVSPAIFPGRLGRVREGRIQEVRVLGAAEPAASP